MRRGPIIVVVALLAFACTASGCSPGESKKPRATSPVLAGPGMWIGAYANPDEKNWAAENTRIADGKMRIRRSFNPEIPDDWSGSAAAKDPAAGAISFHSIRPPDTADGGQDMQGVIDGEYDKEITGWAKGAPRSGPVFATMSHEPEAPKKQLTGKLFVAGFRHFYQVAKAANPNLQLGPVHMSYQWEPDSTTTTKPDEWWVGADRSDFIGVDDYNQATSTDRTTVANDPGFQRWYGWAKKRGKPLALAEYARLEHPTDPDALARELMSAETWLLDHGFKMWLYWNGKGAQADWRMTGAPTIAAWAEIASRGRRS